MTEELACYEFAGNRAGVDGNEGTLTAAAAIVEPARHELFARPRFADDEHRRSGGSDPLHAREDFAHARRAPHHALENRRPRGQVIVIPRLAHVVGSQQLLQQRHEAHRIDRLLQIIRCPELQRFHRAAHRAFARDEHHGGGIFGLAELANQVHATRAGQVQVRHHDVGGLPIEERLGLLSRFGRRYIHAQRGEHRAEQRDLVRLVVDQENATERRLRIRRSVRHVWTLGLVCRIFTEKLITTLSKPRARSGPSVESRISVPFFGDSDPRGLAQAPRGPWPPAPMGRSAWVRQKTDSVGY